MENNKNITITYSWPIALIVFLAFFVAKIYDKIDWSWWWVFSPLWIPIAIILSILIILAIACILVVLLNR